MKLNIWKENFMFAVISLLWLSSGILLLFSSAAEYHFALLFPEASEAF